MLLNEQVLKNVVENQLLIRRKSWLGFWVWDKTIQTFLIVCKDGTILDILDTKDVYSTILNLFGDDWEIIDNHDLKFKLNTYSFTGTTAQKYVQRGLKVKRKVWKNKYLLLCKTHLETEDINVNKELFSLVIDNTNKIDLIPYIFDNDDLYANDWVLCFDYLMIDYYFGDLKSDDTDLVYKKMTISTFKSKLIDFIKAKFVIETVKYQYEKNTIFIKLKEQDVDNYFMLSVKVKDESTIEYIKQYINILLIRK